MNFFSRSREKRKLSCEQIVAAYGSVLQAHPTGGVELPFDAELIKAALVYTAVRSPHERAIEVAKNAFLALNSFVGNLHNTDVSKFSEDALRTALNVELDALEREFESRVELCRSFSDA